MDLVTKGTTQGSGRVEVGPYGWGPRDLEGWGFRGQPGCEAQLGIIPVGSQGRQGSSGTFQGPGPGGSGASLVSQLGWHICCFTLTARDGTTVSIFGGKNGTS